MDRKDKGKTKLIQIPKHRKSVSPMSISSNEGEKTEKFLQQAIKAHDIQRNKQLALQISDIKQISQNYTPISGMTAKPVKNFQNKNQISFGNLSLQKCTDLNKKFRPMIGMNLTEKQQCILDNLWHVQTVPQASSFKVQVLNALCIYFCEQTQKSPEIRSSKPKFSHYVIYRGLKIGIFNKWETVTKFIQCPNPIYKGFTNFSEALKSAREQFGLNSFYIEPEEIQSFSEVVKLSSEQIIQTQEEVITELQEQLMKKGSDSKDICFQMENIYLKQRVALLEAKNTQLTQQLEKKEEKKVVPNIDSFKARILDLPWTQCLKPVLDQFPDFENMVSKKVRTEFPLILFQLQQKLLDIAFNEEDYTGVRVIERGEEAHHRTGLLFIQIQFPTNLPQDLIVQLYHYGMIDYIGFKLNPRTEQLLDRLGEKFTLVVGNMASHSQILSPTIACKIFSSFPDMNEATYRPARKRIFVSDRKEHHSWLQEIYVNRNLEFNNMVCTREKFDTDYKQVLDLFSKAQQTPVLPDSIHGKYIIL